MGARLLLSLFAASAAAAAGAQAPASKTMADVLEASKASDWRMLDPRQTVYLELNGGRVIIELAPQFAPAHVANVLALVREGYFDGLAIMRSQDNYVVQWGDADGKRPIRQARKTLPAEFERSAKDLEFTALPDPDTYAAEVGFSQGFPAARDPTLGRAWAVHCYGMVGAGRDVDVDSGGGSELYAVTGHSPRHLDRNVTLLGRVVQGMELLASLPRGKAELGFYETPQQRVPIRSVRVASDVPEAERTPLEILRTDTQTFTELVESRRNRRDSWFKVPAGRIEVCNVPIPVRARTSGDVTP